MVLVLHQMLVCAMLYLANRLRFLKEKQKEVNGVVLSERAQKALTLLWSQSNIVSFCKAAERFLRCVIPQSVDALLFILNPESGELETVGQERDNVIRLPKSGIARQILESKDIQQIRSLPSDDPLGVIIPLFSSCTENSCNEVTLLPLLDSNDHIVGLSVIVGPTSVDLSCLDFAKSQIVNSLEHIFSIESEHCQLRRQQKFLQVFGRSIETGAGPFCKKLANFVKTQVAADDVVVLILDEMSGELYNRYETDDVLQEKRIEVAGSIFEELIKSKNILNFSEITQNAKEKSDIVRITDHNVQSLLCVPVVSLTNNDVIAFVCAFNKVLPSDRFSKEDEENLRFCCYNITALLENTIEWEKEMVIKRQQEHLLKVAEILFRHADDVSVLLGMIMREAKNLTNAERCSLFLLDRERNELVAKVFDGEIPTKGKNKETWDLTIPANQGIVGQVAMTGKLLNIKDAYKHPLFYSGLDAKTGFKTRNILCFPIKDDDGVIGVAELCNKTTGKCFNKFDEDLTRAFSIYCGISIFHSMLYKRASTAWHRSLVTSELMLYHMDVPQEDVDRLSSQPIACPDGHAPHFDKLYFAPRIIALDDTVPAVMFMFDDLNMIDRWRIPRETLVRFTIMVRKGYRDPPYHNWTHAFTVAHFCYLLCKNTSDIDNKLKDIERLALFVACLCHDLDHRGTNNAFQVSSNSTLAALYSSEGSVMERHHFAQTVCILNSSGCNIFKNLNESEFAKVLDLIRYIILATDLSHHLRILKDITRMTEDGYSSDRDDHRNLLLCLMMTSSDLSDQTKAFEGLRKIADLIYTEFFSQGDLEKVMGFTPMEMMDRERACIPKLQIDFLENIALPVYSVLHAVLPETKAVLDTVLDNAANWKAIREDEEEKGRQAVNGVTNGQ